MPIKVERQALQDKHGQLKELSESVLNGANLRRFWDTAPTGQDVFPTLPQGDADACPGLLDGAPLGLKLVPFGSVLFRQRRDSRAAGSYFKRQSTEAGGAASPPLWRFSSQSRPYSPPAPKRTPKNYAALNPFTIAWSVCFASPKTMRVFSLKKSGFSTPAKPDAIERLSTKTLRA
jgi:hypothetical protein